MNSLFQDLRHALSMIDLRLGVRMMVRQPLLTLTATVALALGIGLSAVGFAFVEALLFSRLPFEGGDRFVRLRVLQEPEQRAVNLSPDEYHMLAAQGTALEHLGALTTGRENVVTASAGLDVATTAGITPSSLAFLPHGPLRGRLLTPADGAPGALPVVMIREAYWRDTLAAAEDVIGMRLEVGGVERTIVGVVPSAFEFPNTPDLWVPLSEGFLEGSGPLDPDARLFGVLVPGRTRAAAQQQLTAIATQIQPTPGATGPVRIEATRFTDLGPPARTMATGIIAVVLAVLIVVAANVANLTLARSFARAGEFALRGALGASRGRLVAQVTVEVLLIGGLAALVGGTAARAALRQMEGVEEIPFWMDLGGGPLTLFLVIGVTLLATAIAGSWPALRVTRRNLSGVLQTEGGRTSDVRFGRLVGAMVVAQLAISVVMLHGALIVGRGLTRYSGQTLDLPANVLTAGVAPSAIDPGASDEGSAVASPQEIEELASTVPGVDAAGLATALPRHSPPAAPTEVEALASEAPRAARMAPSAEVSAGFFAALDARALAGRLFAPDDYLEGALPVAVVNEPFVRKFLGGASPVGRRLRAIGTDGPGAWHEIVGVVPDMGLSVGDPELAAGYYVPLDIDSRPEDRFLYLALRGAGDPMTYVSPLRQSLAEHDPALVLNRPERLEDVLADDRAFFKWLSTGLVALGAITLVLALTGVYAMMALIVTRRTREIGVRVALGATATRVVWTILRRAAWQVALGGAVGGVLAVLSLNARTILVSRLDDGGAWTLPLVLGLLVTAGLGATWLPLRRALRVQPSEAMRVD